MTKTQAAFSTASVRAEVPIQMCEGRHTGVFYTFRGLDDAEEHFAVGLGPQSTVPLVRVHSECITGEVFGSQRCDCGPQLQESVENVSRSGGFIIYLRQEGRGIGLYNKLDCYLLQLNGLDTYEANRSLGYENDLRSYQAAAQMLDALGRRHIRLLTNNPDKRRQLEAFGITVLQTLPTSTFCTQHNRHYLKAKIEKTNHTIDIATPVNSKACIGRS